MDTIMIGRFAPSPSGYMHMGNLLSMLLAWLDIRARGGQMILRMEDLDPARSKPQYASAIADDLRWLGLDWDSGWPEDPSFAQSRRTSYYEEAFQFLREKGLVYPCYCTRAERLAAANAPHPGEASSDAGCRCAFLSEKERAALEAAGRKPAWKIRVPDRIVSVQDEHYGFIRQNLKNDVGDFIIRRADGVFAYQLAVCVDDALMGVSRVIRGRDLLDSAPRQSWLIETLGCTPPDYCHAPLLTDAAGTGKLSKRLGSMSTQVLRERFTPEQLTGKLAHLAGLRPTDDAVSAEDLVQGFHWQLVKQEDILLRGL